MKTLNDLLESRLKDLYSTEDQLFQVLPKIMESTTDTRLKKILSEELNETQNHKNSLRELLNSLNSSGHIEMCRSVAGMIEKVKGILTMELTESFKCNEIISAVRRIVLYKIAGYCTVFNYARELGSKSISQSLRNILNELHRTDQELKRIAKTRSFSYFTY